MPVTKEEMVDYIIEGIPSEALRNQARMHLFSSVQEMMRAFSKVTLKSEQGATSRDTKVGRGAQWKQWREPTEEKSKEAPLKNFKVSSRGAQKCYECNEVGHYANVCPSKKEGSKKPEVGKKTARSCKQVGLVEQKPDDENASTEEDQDEESQSEQEDICFVDLTEEVRDEFQRVAEVKVNGDQQFAGVVRIDTGCPVSLIKNCVVDGESVRRAGREWKRYNGINQSKLRVLGIVEAQVKMEGDSCKVVLGVVPDDTMTVPLLLGRNVLKSLG